MSGVSPSQPKIITPYFSEWLVQQYLSWRGLAFMVGCLALLFLTGCGDAASTYDPKRGRWVDTQEYRRDQINREIDKRGAQADCKSGAGCCRPRVQDTEDPKIECTDEDWRK